MVAKNNISAYKSFPIFLAFLCMGFGDVVGPLVGLAKETFNLSNTMAQLLPFMGFVMFGLLSVPMGVFQDKKGKKFVLMLGMIIALIGLVLPLIGGMTSYGLLLLTVLLLGAGATILQVAGNPIMRNVSPEGKYSRNLSLGQFVKAIGSLSGSLIPFFAARYWGMDWTILFPIYSAILLIVIIVVAFLKIDEKKQENDNVASLSSCLSLLKNKYVLTMVMAIFVYVGAEVSMSSGVPIFLKDQFGIDIKTLGVLGSGFFFLAILIGRFLGSIILSWMSAKRFFVLTSIISLAGFIGLFTGNQIIAIASIFIIGLGFANIFPLVFSITVDSMPERTNELSGLMVMAIVGGALIPLLMGV
ncbi:MAG: MFS transporter, partial [Bacteroidales bacterium]|nr:MFS transporter [Bacteroidales bacterium]